MRPRQIFHDHTGKRNRTVKGTALTFGLLVAIVTTLFALSMLAVPFLSYKPQVGHRFRASQLMESPRHDHLLERLLFHRAKRELWRELEQSRQSAADRRRRGMFDSQKTNKSPIAAAFYATWQETGLHSLRANASKLTHLMPEWLHLNSVGNGLETRDWDFSFTPHNKDVINIAQQNQIQIHPVLNNSEEGHFDPIRAHRLLISTQKQKTLSQGIYRWLNDNHYQGLNLDFENLYPDDYARLVPFIHTLKRELHGLSLSVDIEASMDCKYLSAIANAADFVVVMAYDEHYEGGTPGPISSMGWYNQVLDQTLPYVKPEKLVVGIGNYAYDWAKNKKDAASLTFQSALTLARDYRSAPPNQVVDFDSTALNSTFEYMDDAGVPHEVWILDGISGYNQWLLAKQKKLRGEALWVLGSEDPSLWSYWDRNKIDSLPPPSVLQNVQFPYDIEFDGDGEVLSVLSLPRRGHRNIEVDGKTGLITDMSYSSYPSSYLIKRTGYRPKELALTFDDGPSSDWSPRILEYLKQEKVPATFFVIGENAEAYPNIIQEMWRDGCEIGNHTFTHPNLGAVSKTRGFLEINATQRALESIIGRSTCLFRPPYNADAEPVSAEEIRPVLWASKLGYLTIGEIIDPQDWNLWKTTPDGQTIRRTPQDIAGEIIGRVHDTKGNVILLHDGGGDRSATLAALKIALPALKNQGYQFRGVSQLLGNSRDVLMPPVKPSEAMLVGFDRIVFKVVLTFEKMLKVAFILAIILGIARILFVTALALIARKKQPPRVIQNDLPVSVLVSAYNEQPVITRTIHSILASHYPISELIVVDDGSKDGTADEVEANFKDDPRVKLIRQENTGKAGALNKAIEVATGEILVCLDADTQISPDAISLLAQYFSDPQVGAVAGNVKVGNRINILTYWQSIEYITSQNIDRCAYSLLNTVIVVPGAIGAWRRTAVTKIGGYLPHTLAEDMDLTWRLRKKGWKIGTENRALAYTEAPDTIQTFFKQRFRWAFGTLQCLWMHRDALGRYGWFGCLGLPTLWIFQFFFQILAPFVDLQLLSSIATYLNTWVFCGLYNRDWQPLAQANSQLLHIGFFYALFFAIDLIGALVAFLLEKEDLSLLWWLFWQRFVYRQLMYAVVWKSLDQALRGVQQGWGKLKRKGTVSVST